MSVHGDETRFPFLGAAAKVEGQNDGPVCRPKLGEKNAAAVVEAAATKIDLSPRVLMAMIMVVHAVCMWNGD